MENRNPDFNVTSTLDEDVHFNGSRIETSPVAPSTDTNGHRDGTDDDEIPYEERAQFAGVDAETDDELVTTDELLTTPSTAAGRGVEQSPLTRMAFVGGVLGAIALIIWLLSGLFTGSQQQANDAQQDDLLPTESTQTFGDDDRMRAELALIEQERSQAEPQLAETPPPPSENGETDADDEAVATTTTPTPAPTPAPPPAPPPAAPPPSPTVMPPTETPEAPDPLEQWARLSKAGASGASVALVPEPEIDAPGTVVTQETTNVAPQEANPDSDTVPFPADTVGDDPVPLPNQGGITRREAQSASTSPGAQGIIQQRSIPSTRETSTETPNTNALQQVAIGTSTKGQVIVPVIYAGGDASAQGRFAIELVEPLMDINGDVALDAGTVLITQITEVLDANILRQQVVAIVYRDANNQVRQEAIAPGILVVRGEDNQPLVAEVHHDGNNSDLGEDLLVGALSALGNIGAVVNAPDTLTTAVSEAAGSNTTTSTSTTVTGGQDDDVVAAALEGFFTPISERVAERFDPQQQTTASPYLLIPEGEEVSIFVNGLLEVAR